MRSISYSVSLTIGWNISSTHTVHCSVAVGVSAQQCDLSMTQHYRSHLKEPLVQTALLHAPCSVGEYSQSCETDWTLLVTVEKRKGTVTTTLSCTVWCTYSVSWVSPTRNHFQTWLNTWNYVHQTSLKLNLSLDLFKAFTLNLDWI